MRVQSFVTELNPVLSHTAKGDVEAEAVIGVCPFHRSFQKSSNLFSEPRGLLNGLAGGPASPVAEVVISPYIFNTTKRSESNKGVSLDAPFYLPPIKAFYADRQLLTYLIMYRCQKHSNKLTVF
jgi:hypothetical protein